MVGITDKQSADPDVGSTVKYSKWESIGGKETIWEGGNESGTILHEEYQPSMNLRFRN